MLEGNQEVRDKIEKVQFLCFKVNFILRSIAYVPPMYLGTLPTNSEVLVPTFEVRSLLLARVRGNK